MFFLCWLFCKALMNSDLFYCVLRFFFFCQGQGNLKSALKNTDTICWQWGKKMNRPTFIFNSSLNQAKRKRNRSAQKHSFNIGSDNNLITRYFMLLVVLQDIEVLIEVASLHLIFVKGPRLLWCLRPCSCQLARATCSFKASVRCVLKWSSSVLKRSVLKTSNTSAKAQGSASVSSVGIYRQRQRTASCLWHTGWGGKRGESRDTRKTKKE